MSIQEIFSRPEVSIACTIGFYMGGKYVYHRTKWLLFSPVIVSIVAVMLLLRFMKIPFEEYNQGGQWLTWPLGPSVVALGVLLHEKFELVKKQALGFLLSVVVGSLGSMLSIMALALFCKLPEELTLSILPKSITTPIALEVTAMVGGIPSLTAGVVIFVGIIGNAFGPLFLTFFKINRPATIGLALGTASHGIGTARAVEFGELAGAYSGLAMCLNGLLTVVTAPYLWQSLQPFFV
ncbi:LrgB family protein [Rapidithrix thailandica]|uniref:LrgB family protein n=1 Tax=Rapidithrix thailandica TaxID=413964 RepID=A0AAW9SED2_9BACT